MADLFWFKLAAAMINPYAIGLGYLSVGTGYNCWERIFRLDNL
jgi:hypothetical protein